MATIDWPNVNILPQEIFVNSFNQLAISNNIRTSIEAGVDKVRRRYTTPIVTMKGKMWLTHQEYLNLENFYNITLQGGVQRFNFKDPADQTRIYEYRFVSPPSYSALSSNYYEVSLNWERLQLKPTDLSFAFETESALTITPVLV